MAAEPSVPSEISYAPASLPPKRPRPASAPAARRPPVQPEPRTPEKPNCVTRSQPGLFSSFGYIPALDRDQGQDNRAEKRRLQAAQRPAQPYNTTVIASAARAATESDLATVTHVKMKRPATAPPVRDPPAPVGPPFNPVSPVRTGSVVRCHDALFSAIHTEETGLGQHPKRTEKCHDAPCSASPEEPGPAHQKRCHDAEEWPPSQRKPEVPRQHRRPQRPESAGRRGRPQRPASAPGGPRRPASVPEIRSVPWVPSHSGKISQCTPTHVGHWRDISPQVG